MRFSSLLWMPLLVLTAFAGCAEDEPAPVDDVVLPPVDLPEIEVVEVVDAMLFNESIVTAAVGYNGDLYEPTIEVSQSGVIYVAGHVIAVDTTGTPAYFSKDDGATWAPLPFAGPAQIPPPGQGAAPPPGDEGFIVAGDNGEAWMVDITLLTFPVTGWCGDGAEQCYHNPNAYDPVLAHSQPCSLGSLNDRPWAAYANGTLLMVNNPGGGPVQVGAMKVPPAMPAGFGGAEWNLCASSGGWIPGVPGLRDDGFFAVPQVDGNKLHVVLGNAANVQDVRQVDVFEVENAFAGGGSNYGHATFDGDGVLYVSAFNNTEKGGNPDEGRIKVAVSTDDGETFQERTFVVGEPVRFFYLDGNVNGPGALLTWSTPGEGAGSDDWYAAHVQVRDGQPVLENVSFVGSSVGAYGHVIGSAVGPDGRAYLATFHSPDDLVGYVGSNPLRVWVQGAGAALPVTAMETTADE